MITKLPAAVLVALGAMLVANPTTTRAQAYPSKTVRFIVPFAAGSTTDILARMVAQKLTEAWGQQIIVDNRPGHGGNIGSDVVAKAAPDGYTILVSAASTLAINASLYRNMPYDTATAFAPITLIAKITNVLVVHAAGLTRSASCFSSFYAHSGNVGRTYLVAVAAL